MCSVRSPSVIHLKHTSKKSQMVAQCPISIPTSVFAYLTHPQTGCAIVWADGHAYHKQQCTRVGMKRIIVKCAHIIYPILFCSVFYGNVSSVVCNDKRILSNTSRQHLLVVFIILTIGWTLQGWASWNITYHNIITNHLELSLLNNCVGSGHFLLFWAIIIDPSMHFLPFKLIETILTIVKVYPPTYYLNKNVRTNNF